MLSSMLSSMLLLLALSAILRCVAEIHNHRLSWAIKPIEHILKYKNEYNVDPYHVTSNLHWMITMIVGVIICPQYLEWNLWKIIIAEIGVWFYHGLIFDLFYHIIFIKKEKRDPQNIWIIKIIRLINFE